MKKSEITMKSTSETDLIPDSRTRMWSRRGTRHRKRRRRPGGRIACITSYPKGVFQMLVKKLKVELVDRDLMLAIPCEKISKGAMVRIHSTNCVCIYISDKHMIL